MKKKEIYERLKKMAIKDWKLVKKDDTFTTWQKVRKGEEQNLFLTIFKQDYNQEAWGYKKPIDYPITIGTCSNKSLEKIFKTKKEALSFAKNYMRRNK